MNLEQTTELYLKEIQRVAKYGKIDNLNEFEDGRVTRFLLEQGHSPENIEQAITKFSPVAFQRANDEKLPVSQKEYASNLINRGQNVIKALNEIKEFDSPKPKDVKLDAISEYKQLAHQYIEKYIEQNKVIPLNSSMDNDISFKMLQRGHSKVSVEEALLEVSPVAQEAGRSTEGYAAYVLNKASEGWEKYLEKQKMVDANYHITAKEYFDKKEALKEGLNTAYQDGRIVRELIGQGHTQSNLIKAVAENAIVKENKKPEDYAKYIVHGVVAEIRAEQNILNFDIEAAKKNQSPALEDKYLLEAKKLFDRSQGETFNSFIDTRVATDLIKNNVDPEKIKEVISELSPAAKRPGMTLDYSNKVIEKANERIVYEQKIENDYSAVVIDYVRNAEQIRQANPGKDYSDYFDGKIAARLLERGHAKENVQKVLSEVSIVANKLEQEKGWNPERYGKSIVYRTMESMSRFEAVKTLEPKENPEIKAPTIKEEYQHQLKAFINKSPYINANADIQIAKTLLTQGYNQEEINKTIREVSPVAIEAGRNLEKYAQYIQSSVERSLEKNQSYKKENTKEPVKSQNKADKTLTNSSKTTKKESRSKETESPAKERGMSR